MEFSISNVCNLECVMCNGNFSSAIRAHRDQLPPAKSVYSNAFDPVLRSILPHLFRAKFLGGEPFLIPVVLPHLGDDGGGSDGEMPYHDQRDAI